MWGFEPTPDLLWFITTAQLVSSAFLFVDLQRFYFSMSMAVDVNFGNYSNALSIPFSCI